MKVEQTEKMVTPAMAGKWMDEHCRRVGEGKFRQRPLSMTLVLRYAQLMRDGLWILTPDGLVFDEHGNLCQGQHRLEAVRRSGCSIPFMVSTGWPRETIKALDQGKARSVGALLAIDGYVFGDKLGQTLSAIAKVAYRGVHIAMTYPNAVYLLDKFDMHTHIKSILGKAPNTTHAWTASDIGPLAWYHLARPQKARDFAEGYFNFETQKGSAVNLFLHWIRSGRWLTIERGSMKSAGSRRMAGLCACLRAWDDGNSMTKIVPTPDAIQWLADRNPQLRDWIRAHVTGNYTPPKKTPGKQSRPAKKKVRPSRTLAYGE